jgi:hypothetical protein
MTEGYNLLNDPHVPKAKPMLPESIGEVVLKPRGLAAKSASEKNTESSEVQLPKRLLRPAREVPLNLKLADRFESEKMGKVTKLTPVPAALIERALSQSKKSARSRSRI